MIDVKQVPVKPIGVFDPRIGGLTVIRALLHELPRENIVFVSVIYYYRMAQSFKVIFKPREV